MPYVCGVDVGYRNLAVAVLDSETKEIVYLNLIGLCEEVIEGKRIVYEFDQKILDHFVAKFVVANESMFKKCSLFCIENQISVRHMRVQFGLEAMFSRYGRALSVHPSTVKAHFGTRKGEYAANKHAAVAWCRNNLEGDNLERFKDLAHCKDKLDDVADAIMQALYGIAKKEELMTINLVEVGSKKKKKKKRKRAKGSGFGAGRSGGRASASSLAGRSRA